MSVTNGRSNTATVMPGQEMARTPDSTRLVVGGAALKRRTSLTLPQGMDIHAWRHLGRQIFVVSDSSAWWLGDWLIYGQAQYPDRYKRAVVETSLDYQTLRNYAWVARQFAPARRRDKLSFQHHAEVTRLSEEEQDRWLDQAEKSGWSRNELRRRIKASREPEGQSGMVALIQMNVIADQKRRWQEAAQSEEKDLLAWMFEILDQAAVHTIEGRRSPALSDEPAPASDTAAVAP